VVIDDFGNSHVLSASLDSGQSSTGRLSPERVSPGNLYLGCPVWSCAAWAGHFLTSDARQRDFLSQYSSVFNTVEGNSTFYALPNLDTVRRWAVETPLGFRFALKFPRDISHDKQLVRAERETEKFLEILRILASADRLGPSFLQLSPKFDGTQFPALETYLRNLAKEKMPLAVEVRHADYFDSGLREQALDDLLKELAIDRVIFDSRPLFSARPSDESEIESQRRKPQSPLRLTVTGQHPFLRLVGRNSLETTRLWLEEWAPIIAGWLQQGRTPYVFAHTPDDFFAPAMARVFHQELQKYRPEEPNLPVWPNEKRAAIQAKQKTLF
jgi:uncharacterized protein YecE (DUF72 family)